VESRGDAVKRAEKREEEQKTKVLLELSPNTSDKKEHLLPQHTVRSSMSLLLFHFEVVKAKGDP